MVECVFILVLVAIVVIAAQMIFGPLIGNTFSMMNGSLKNLKAAGIMAAKWDSINLTESHFGTQACK